MDLEDQAQIMAGLQRSRANNEIAALRAEIQQMRNEEAAAPKCPYCFGAIVNGAVKCRHCASNIEWWFFEGETGPAKEGDAKNIEAQLYEDLREELEEQERREKKIAEAFEAKLGEFEREFSLNCKGCNQSHNIKNENDLAIVEFNKGLCSSCFLKNDRKLLIIFLTFIAVVGIIWAIVQSFL